MPLNGNSKYYFMLGWVRELEAGRAHIATRGQEYSCLSESFRSVVYAAAAEKGLAATVMVFPTCVVFAFYQRQSYLRPNLSAFPVVKKMKAGL